jgi:SSS family solute:Na+ symporter
MTPLIVIGGYLGLLLGVGLLGHRLFRGTSTDYFLASRSIGPFMLLMSLFGTTMTAFALVGSTGKAYVLGIGVFGLMASWAAIVHPAMFHFVGRRVWDLGHRLGHVTQVQLFRDRFESPLLGALLFPILVGLVIPYLLIGVLGAGATVAAVTKGAVSPALTSAVVSAVVLVYVSFGGIRAATFANTFQTLVFLAVGVLTFFTIADALGGAEAATARTALLRPELLSRGDLITQPHFLSYALVGMSVGMFPHLFQHWLTARSSSAFNLSIVWHPLLVMLVWLPCVMMGVWAAGLHASGELALPPAKANAVLGIMVAHFTGPWMSGVLTAGILAAIMSSLDSQFLALGTMFTEDIAARIDENLSETKKIWMARGFIAAIVIGTWLLSLFTTRGIFDLGVWCFSGFTGLTPLVIAALYWRRATRIGAIACVLTTAVAWTTLFIASLQPGAAEHGEFLVGGVMPVVWIFGASSLALVVGSLLSTPPSDATLARYFPGPEEAA